MVSQVFGKLPSYEITWNFKRTAFRGGVSGPRVDSGDTFRKAEPMGEEAVYHFSRLAFVYVHVLEYIPPSTSKGTAAASAPARQGPRFADVISRDGKKGIPATASQVSVP
jgi:hypothetical protein